MSQPDVSIIVSSFNIANISKLYESINKSCQRHSFELVVVSPFPLPSSMDQIPQVVYARDFGSPARAFCIGATLANGKTILPFYDDGIFREDALDTCLDQYEELKQKHKNVLVNLIYTEGQEYLSNSDPRECNANHWFKARFHDDLRVPGVSEAWWISLLFLMERDFYNSIGGLDAEHYEVMNSNLHNLVFRAQQAGVHYEHSKVTIANLDCQFGRTIHNSPIIAAYMLNDKPYFHNVYATPESAAAQPVVIDPFNYKRSEAVWSRRWKKS